MGAKLDALKDLHEIELQIADIQQQIARKQRAVDVQRKKAQNAKAAVDAKKAECRRAQAEFDELDLDIKARSGNVDRMREHLNTVRTNKDYHTVLAQLNTMRADLTKVETHALERMEGVESLKKQIADLEKLEQDDLARLKQVENEHDQTRGMFADKLATLEAQRAAYAKAVDPQILKLVARLSERHGGDVMAYAERRSARSDEYLCGGCNITLGTDVANSLRIKDEVLTCKSCGRILYLKKA